MVGVAESTIRTSVVIDGNLNEQVVDLVWAMEDFERGLQEMAHSVEHMQAMIMRSPVVKDIIARNPKVAGMCYPGSENGNSKF